MLHKKNPLHLILNERSKQYTQQRVRFLEGYKSIIYTPCQKMQLRLLFKSENYKVTSNASELSTL